MINNQKLTGLNVSEKPSLTPPAQLLNKNNAPAQNIQVELLPEPDKNNKGSALSDSDSIGKMINLGSSALAGGIAASKTAQNVGIIGESMRMMQVQQGMVQMQARMANSGYNNYNTGYNNYQTGYNNYNTNSYDPTGGYNNGGYNNGYGGTEYSRYGRSEALYGRRYGGIEDYTMNGQYPPGQTSPEMQMAYRNIASGAITGLKYGSLIGGGISAVVNAYNVITGKEKGSEAVGSVAADTVTAGLSGSAGAVAGGFTALGLAAAGVGGVPGLVLAIGAGAVGATATQFLLQKSGIYDSLKNKVMNMVAGKK
jgi:hypothetical protein